MPGETAACATSLCSSRSFIESFLNVSTLRLKGLALSAWRGSCAFSRRALRSCSEHRAFRSAAALLSENYNLSLSLNYDLFKFVPDKRLIRRISMISTWAASCWCPRRRMPFADRELACPKNATNQTTRTSTRRSTRTGAGPKVLNRCVCTSRRAPRMSRRSNQIECTKQTKIQKLNVKLGQK